MADRNVNVRSGNRVIVFFDDQQVGLMQSVRMNDEYSPEPASGIGDIHCQEYVPTMARHSLSVSNMVLNRKTLRDLGLAAENGDGVLQGIVFDICVVDKDSGELLRKYIGCTYSGGDVDVSKHAIVMNSAQFLALDVQGTGL